MSTLLAQSSYDPSNPGALLAAMGASVAFIGILALAFTAFYVLMAYMIAKKAGYNPLLALLILIPGANLILLIIFAFSDWPVLRELRALRAAAGGGPSYGGYAGGGYPPPSPAPGPLPPLPPTVPPPAPTS